MPPVVLAWRDLEDTSPTGLTLTFQAIGHLLDAVAGDAGDRHELQCLARPTSVDVQCALSGGNRRVIVAGYRGPDELERFLMLNNRVQGMRT